MRPPSLPVHTCNQEIYILIIYVTVIRNRIADLSKTFQTIISAIKETFGNIC